MLHTFITVSELLCRSLWQHKSTLQKLCPLQKGAAGTINIVWHREHRRTAFKGTNHQIYGSGQIVSAHTIFESRNNSLPFSM